MAKFAPMSTCDAVTWEDVESQAAACSKKWGGHNGDGGTYNYRI
jgi:hypothetical protein